MSYVDYEHCQGCDGKAIYAGDTDVPEDVVVWHRACLEAEIFRRIREALAAVTGAGESGGDLEAS